jgi:hypothetical protein
MKAYKRMFMPWNLTMSHIKMWLRKKELKFAQDTRNPKFTPCKYLDKYVFRDLNEVFFYEFPHLLQ